MAVSESVPGLQPSSQDALRAHTHTDTPSCSSVCRQDCSSPPSSSHVIPYGTANVIVSLVWQPAVDYTTPTATHPSISHSSSSSSSSATSSATSYSTNIIIILHFLEYIHHHDHIIIHCQTNESQQS
eukprot:scpid10734/ scgid20271/ 